MLKNLKRNSATVLSIFSILAISAVLFSLLACVVTADRGPYHTQEPYSRPGDLRRIQGLWFINNAGSPGKLEFYLDGHMWTGRIWIDVYQQWETLTDIIVDPRTGALQFNRPAFNAPYYGTLSGNQIVGTFVYQGNTYSWEARHQ
jgi:hypothetical protein